MPIPAPAAERFAVERRIQPTPTVDVSRMTRYRGGTYSHTVDTIAFADGSTARTDLIRLNPNIEAYSLDFAGIAPTRPSRYAADSWAAVPHLQARAHEAEVAWILRNSYPALSTTVISKRLRDAGYPLGSRNITEHEVIAGTQAAIWHLANGLELDVRPLDVPINLEVECSCVRVEFDGDRQLAGYTADVSSDSGAVLRLEKSLDGLDWDEVAASAVIVPAGGGRVARSLGVGSTISHNRNGGRGGGHHHYRLMVEGDACVQDITFHLHGSKRYRNSESTVYLYNYLLAGAKAAREAAVTPSLIVTDATTDGDLIGPFQLVTADAAMITASEGYRVVRDGVAAAAVLVPPSEDFYLHGPLGTPGATITVSVPGEADGFGGRVLTGVVRDESDGRYTPLALAVPVQTVVEFDIDWSADLDWVSV